MTMTAPTATLMIGCALALVVCASGGAAAEPQQVSVPPVNAERIAQALKEQPAEGFLSLDNALPVATFRTSVEQRVYLLTFQELLRKEFKLTPLQEQSQDWYGRCCGIDLLGLVNSLEKKLKRREERKIREQVLRELAAVEAAAKRSQ